MLTALHLRNFKDVSDGQCIELAPLTLLCGSSGAGKSTIVQAILYLRELIAHGMADVEHTTLGGDVLELGRFERLVHRHEIHRSIVLRAQLRTPRSLQRFGRSLDRFVFPNLDNDIGGAWLELTIRRRTTAAFRGPVVDRAVIGVAGSEQPLVWLELGATLREREPMLARVNLGHPILGEAGPEVAKAWSALAQPEAPLAPRSEHADPNPSHEPRARASVEHDGLLLSFALSCSRRCALPPLDEPLRVLPPYDEDDHRNDHDNGGAALLATTEELRAFLEMVVLGTTHQLASVLQSILYVGPQRAVPPRDVLYERPGHVHGWAHGLAAWELLLARGSKDLVDRTNDWLTRLGMNSRVIIQDLVDRTMAANAPHAMVRRLQLETDHETLVFPSEAGFGISQILPVVVAALLPRVTGLIDKPELHVPPAVQLRLGDLFIEAAIRDRTHPMVVETHSEHLIQSVLRRLSQTSSDELPEGTRRVSPETLSLVYVARGPLGTRFHRVPLDENDFDPRWLDTLFGREPGERERELEPA